MKKLLIAIGVLVILVVAGVWMATRIVLVPEWIRTTLQAEASHALREPVAIGGASVTLWPRAGIELTNVTIGQAGAMSLKRVQVATGMRALLGRRIEDADILMEDSALSLPAVMALVDRLATPAASASTTQTPAPVTLVNVRSIALRRVAVTAQGRTGLFDVESSLAGDRLDIDTMSVTAEGTTLMATGAVESLTARRVRLAITADTLNLDGLMAFGNALASAATTPQTPTAATPSAPAPLDLVATVVATQGTAAGVTFRDLKTTATVTTDGITLNPFTFGVFGGHVDGTVSVATHAAQPVLAVRATLNQIDMVQLTAFAGQPGAMTGVLGGSIALKGTGTEPKAALAAATGTGTLAIANGRMQGLQLVRAIVLVFGKPEVAQPAGNGEAFSRLSASFSLGSGVVTLSDLAFVSRDVELQGSGALRLAGSRLDVNANAMLSEDLTRQAGRDLVRYTAANNRVTVPATVSGTVSDPRVRIDIGNLAKRAIQGIFRRKKPG